MEQLKLPIIILQSFPNYTLQRARYLSNLPCPLIFNVGSDRLSLREIAIYFLMYNNLLLPRSDSRYEVSGEIGMVDAFEE